jgi:hypothetical protein
MDRYLCIFFCIILYLYLINYNKETFSNKKKINIFWTGGYDSTFRLCYLLIMEKKIVQPYYFTCKIDSNLESNIYRRNKKNEIDTMNKIRIYINKKFPELGKNLLETVYIDKIPENKKLREELYYIGNYKKYKHRRKYSQYSAMALYTLKYKKYIEVGYEEVIGDGTQNSLDKNNKTIIDDNYHDYIKNNLVNYKGNYCIKVKNSPLRFLHFPIAFLDKKSMKKLSIRLNFYDVLLLTFSCWYPINNKPCGKCTMCKKRII